MDVASQCTLIPGGPKKKKLNKNSHSAFFLFLDHPVLYMSGIKIDSSWRLQSCHSRHSLSESVVIVGIHFLSEFNCCCLRSFPFANRCCCNFNCHQYSITTTVYWTKTNIGGYKLYAGTVSSTMLAENETIRNGATKQQANGKSLMMSLLWDLAFLCKGLSVRPSVGPTVRRSVGDAFVKIKENQCFVQISDS